MLPSPIPDTRPETGSTVTIELSLLDQVPPGWVEATDVVFPSQIDKSLILKSPVSRPESTTVTPTVDVEVAPPHIPESITV